MLAKLVHFHMKLFMIHSDVDFAYSVHGPGELTSVILEEIAFFRIKRYEELCPYLLTPTQSLIENKLMIDERSFHVLARRKSTGEIVGALRLTPYKFELTELTTDFQFAEKKYQNKLEIGRLITDPKVKNVGKKLMILAGIHTVENTNYTGFIGACKLNKFPFMEKFGMNVISNVLSLKGRPDKYVIISSDFKTMRTSVLKNYATRLTKIPYLRKDQYGPVS